MDDSQSSQGNISPMPPHPPVQKGQCDSHRAELQLHWCTWLQAVGGEVSLSSFLCFPSSGSETSQKNRMARTDRREVWTQGKDATLPPDTAKANNEYNSHRDQPWIPDKDQERRWKRLGICSEWQLSKTMSTILSQSFLLSQFHVLPCRGVKDRDLLSNAAAETPPRCPQPPSHTAHLLWDTVSWHAGKLTMAIPRKKWHSYKHETFKGTALCMEGNCLEKSWEQGRRWSWSLVSVQVMVLRSELFPPFLQDNSRTIFPLMSKSF